MYPISALSLIITAALSYTLYALTFVTDLKTIGVLVLGMIILIYIANVLLSLAKTLPKNRFLNPAAASRTSRSLAFTLPSAVFLLAVGIVEGANSLLGFVQIALALIVALSGWMIARPEFREHDTH